MAVIDTITGRNKVQTVDEIDYIENGNLHIGARTGNILVSAETDQASLTGYEPGSIAHTAGWAKIWELDVDGETWVELLT